MFYNKMNSTMKNLLKWILLLSFFTILVSDVTGNVKQGTQHHYKEMSMGCEPRNSRSLQRYVENAEGNGSPRFSSFLYSFFLGRKIQFNHIHAVSLRKVPTGPNSAHN
ncbi:uncharacterized protein LOC114184307 [Vigna unguiculata]|uniref:uncharacterized protein LOC114184307 n=1 Tax=Vigna unguiculata TaxID=3917 RepID=UPI001016D46B|nr:uncharacterized protein LOC114184307 [Vigna unguiculata]